MNLNKWKIISFLLIPWQFSIAQSNLCNNTSSEKGSFTVTPNIGIEPLDPITITDNSGGTNVAYFFNYQPNMTFDFVNNPANGKLVQTNTTTSGITQLRFAGTYQILQFGTKNGRRMYACRTVEILPAGDPEFSYLECNGTNIELTISDLPVNRKFTSFVIDWNGTKEVIPAGTSLPIQRQRSYSMGSNLNISVEGEFQASGNTFKLKTTKNITLVGSRQEARIQKIETTADGSAMITYTGEQNIVYDISTPPITIAGGRVNVNVLQKGSGNPVRLTGLNPNVSTVLVLYHLMRCGDNRLSNPVPAIFLTKTDYSNGNAELEWTRTNAASSYVIYREIDGVAQPSITVNTNTYSEPVLCDGKYCYQVEATTTAASVGNTIGFAYGPPVGSITAKSLTEKRCITPSSPPPITDGLVSIENNQVKVEILENITPAPLSYTFYRAEEGTNTFTKLQNQAGKTFLDGSIDPSSKRFCYQFTYTNQCNRESPNSPTYCPVFLSVNTSSSKILWTNYEDFNFIDDDIASYEIEKLDNSQNIISSQNAGINLEYQELPQNITDGFYRIKATSRNGLISYSNLFETFAFPKMLLPEAFTPNNDTENDELKVYGSLGRISDFKLDIYNRWGVLIHTLNDKSATWDGKIDGNDAPIGVYQYKITAKLVTGEDIEKKGNVILLR